MDDFVTITYDFLLQLLKSDNLNVLSEKEVTYVIFPSDVIL